MKKAIQFGAGNIGRGFIGAVLSRAGYRVTFADINREIIDGINAEGGYTVHIKDVDCYEIPITRVSAVRSDSPAVIGEIASADIVTTAVGLNALKIIAPVIAEGIRARRRAGTEAPLNLIACENGLRATSRLKDFVLARMEEADRAWCREHVGFPDCAVDRIVPPVPTERPTDIVAEKFFEWVVERKAVIGDCPDIEGVIYADDILAYNERKLFTLNTGHSMAAFLGQEKGYHTIREAITDPGIYADVRAVMQQSGEGLVRKFGFDHRKHFEYIEIILQRFKNPYLSDEVTRVGRQPLRKLSRYDRFVEPMMIARSYGLPYDKFELGIAAALRFRNEEDEETVRMHRMITEMGCRQALIQITSLPETDPVVGEIVALVRRRIRQDCIVE